MLVNFSVLIGSGNENHDFPDLSNFECVPFLSHPPAPASVIPLGVTQIERFTFKKDHYTLDKLDKDVTSK